jgi:[phosphatase 2A protein]-leucine-carboxy methyltransferase
MDRADVNQTRHLTLPGASPFRDPASQAERFRNPELESGAFHTAGAKSLWQIREEVIPDEELRR